MKDNKPRKNELFLEAFNDPGVCRDFLEKRLDVEFTTWLAQQGPYHIKNLSSKIAKPFLDETRDADVVLGLYTDSLEEICFIAIEAQSEPHALMGARCAFYNAGLILNEYKKRSYRSAPPLIGCVYHCGDGAKSFKCLTPLYKHLAPALKKQAMTFDKDTIHVFEPAKQSDDELIKHGLFAVFEILFKYSHQFNFTVLEKVMNLLMDHTPNTRAKCLHYFINRSDLDRMQFVKIVNSYLEENESMTIAEQFREEGRDQGAERMRVAIAQNLLSQGSTLHDVANATELSLDEVKQLRDESVNGTGDTSSN